MALRNSPRSWSSFHRVGPIAGVVLITALTGCGGGGASKSAAAAPSTTAPASGGPNRAALQAFRDCMAKNGSPLPTFARRPTNGSTPTSAAPDNAGGAPGNGRRRFGGGIGNVATSADPAVQRAFAACKSTLPAGFLQQQQQVQQQRAAYVSCMKDHGVTLPSGPPVPGAPTTTIDRTSPTYQAAQAICGQLLPQRRGGTTTTVANS